jgi:alpha-galactosidase
MKITFIGAGSTVFLKNIVGDIFLTEGISGDLTLALYDIEEMRLHESRHVVEALNRQYNGDRATIETFHGTSQRRTAVQSADFVMNMIQVGGYRPATVVDFEIPKEFGLRQTIADTLGIGGIFRGLRTIPVILDLAADMEAVAPTALLLNYTNPMAIVTGAVQMTSSISTVGLCHSVQSTAEPLLKALDMEIPKRLRWYIAGINHMAWLLDIRDGERDIYPEIRRRGLEKNEAALADPEKRHDNMIRYEIMRLFGYYITESSEHNAEYTPFWIKSAYPEMIERYNVPLDEYPRRCEEQLDRWATLREELVSGKKIEHTLSTEYAARIVHAAWTGEHTVIHGNTLNTQGLISNLPRESVVEVETIVDGMGLHPTCVGALPPQCAALNQTNINVQTLTIQAALKESRDHVYQAALLDPHTAAELPPDRIIELCDRLLDAHKEFLPAYR